MSDNPQLQPQGWYYAQGDPPGTQRYWNGETWEGDPQPVPGAPQEVTGGPMPAGVGARIGGRIIDWIVWIVTGSIIQGVIVGGDAFSFDPDVVDDLSRSSTVIAGLLALAVVVAYETYLVGARGATLGKMVTGTKVVKPDGSPADMMTGLRRIGIYAIGALVVALLGPAAALTNLINFILFIVGIVSLVFLFTNSQRRTVWDLAAPSMVVGK
ncbi:MAG: RDD family protein [Actinomycetota bacterium]